MSGRWGHKHASFLHVGDAVMHKTDKVSGLEIQWAGAISVDIWHSDNVREPQVLGRNQAETCDGKPDREVGGGDFSWQGADSRRRSQPSSYLKNEQEAELREYPRR